ncbi:MAG: septum formation initiator family protein [Pseudomonadota bacterium]
MGGVTVRLGLFVEILLPVLLVGWAAIMIFGATVSTTGYRSLDLLRGELAELDEGLSKLTAHRQWMDNRAQLLQSAALDPDMVDERIRGVLGYAQDGDMVITRKDLRAAVARARTAIDILPASAALANLAPQANTPPRRPLPTSPDDGMVGAPPAKPVSLAGLIIAHCNDCSE